VTRSDINKIRLKKKGFTLVEILVVLVSISILAALAWPNYLSIKEKTLNREAKAILLLMRTVEKSYKMEHGEYYPELTSTSVISDINRDLKLSVTVSNWAITLDTTTSGSEFALATRSASDRRVWKLMLSGDADPACTGTYCS